jgi:hypothetical protein
MEIIICNVFLQFVRAGFSWSVRIYCLFVSNTQKNMFFGFFSNYMLTRGVYDEVKAGRALI